jgi:hypothetical protein
MARLTQRCRRYVTVASIPRDDPDKPTAVESTIALSSIRCVTVFLHVAGATTPTASHSSSALVCRHYLSHRSMRPSRQYPPPSPPSPSFPFLLLRTRQHEARFCVNDAQVLWPQRQRLVRLLQGHNTNACVLSAAWCALFIARIILLRLVALSYTPPDSLASISPVSMTLTPCFMSLQVDQEQLSAYFGSITYNMQSVTQ